MTNPIVTPRKTPTTEQDQTLRPELPDDFEFPRVSRHLTEALTEAFAKVIDEYLPPVWAEAVHTYAIVYAADPDGPHTLADYRGWLKRLEDLQLHLAGARYDERGVFIGCAEPAPKLGKAGAE
jgi:hypothetical protein